MEESIWNRVMSKYRAAMDLPEAEREQICKALIEQYPDAREMLEMMFTNYSQTQIHFLEADSLVMESDLFHRSVRLGGFIGHFQLKRELGKGGMGVVYLAEQFIPINRQVALKVIRTESAGARAIRLFEEERKALALMNHRAIATILEAGETPEGFPYLAMEYVDGAPIQHYCNQHKLDLRTRIEIFIEAAKGIQHAHQRGLLHRDIKPTNILVQYQDGHHLPKIIDFGLARLFDPEGRGIELSRTGIQGTPAYMSPEQITGEGIDTRSDLYALSLVLYQLLTGFLPYEQETVTVSEILKRVLLLSQKPFPRASQKLKSTNSRNWIESQMGMSKPAMLKLLRSELDWILEKGMSANPEDRYESIGAFVADLRRFLDGKAVEARPPNFAYRWRKQISRHKGLFLALSMILLAILAGSSAAIIGWKRALAATQLAHREEGKARAINHFLQDMLGSADPHNQGREIKVSQVLDQAAEKLNSDFQDQVSIRVALLTVIGKTYRGIGEPKKGRDLLEKAVQLAQKQLPDSDMDSLKARVEYAESLIDNETEENSQKALDIYKKALKDLEDSGAIDAPIAFQICNNLGSLYFHASMFEQAISFMRRSYEGRLRILGPNHEKTMTSEGNLIFMLSYAGQREEAAEMERDVLAKKTSHLGPEHPSTLATGKYLAQMEQSLGLLQAADQRLQDHLKKTLKTFGPNHERVAQALTLEAEVLLLQARFLEAKTLLEQARALFEGSLENDYWLDLVDEHRANALSHIHEFEAASALFTQLLQKVNGENSPYWCDITYQSLLNDWRWKNQSPKALKKAEQCLSMQGHFKHETGEKHLLLGQVALEWNPQLAEKHLRIALENLPQEKTLSQQTNLWLANALLRQHRNDEVMKLLEPMLKGPLMGNWPENENFWLGLVDYGEALASLGKDPLPAWESALKRAQQICHSNDGRVIGLERRLAQQLHKQDPNKAQELLKDALARAEKTRGKEHPISLEIRQQMLVLQQ